MVCVPEIQRSRHSALGSAFLEAEHAAPTSADRIPGDTGVRLALSRSAANVACADAHTLILVCGKYINHQMIECTLSYPAALMWENQGSFIGSCVELADRQGCRACHKPCGLCQNDQPSPPV